MPIQIAVRICPPPAGKFVTTNPLAIASTRQLPIHMIFRF